MRVALFLVFHWIIQGMCFGTFVNHNDVQNIDSKHVDIQSKKNDGRNTDKQTWVLHYVSLSFI